MDFKIFTDYVKKKLNMVRGINVKVKRGISYINIVLYYEGRKITIYVRNHQYKAIACLLKNKIEHDILLEAFDYFLIDSAIDFKYNKRRN